MITFPNSLVKGQDLTFTLDKTAFFAVVSDEYFSVEANVEKIIFVYRSEDGHQRKRIQFMVSDSAPSDAVGFSEKANDVFNLEQIILVDYDGGTHVVSPSVVSLSEQTITFNSSPSEEIYFAFDGTNDANLGGFDVGAFFS
jgi:hypothetical protein